MVAFFCPLSSILQIFLSFVKTKNIIVFKSLNISICICVLFIFNENCFFSYTIYPKQFPFLQLLLTPPTSTFFLLQCHSPSTSFSKKRNLSKTTTKQDETRYNNMANTLISRLDKTTQKVENICKNW